MSALSLSRIATEPLTADTVDDVAIMEVIQPAIDSGRIQLDDFVYSYPEKEDPEFQAKITAKKEFQDFRAALRENIPEEGGFFNAQIVVDRFMQHYDELFLIARAGVGKTGSALGAAQHMKEASVKSKVDVVARYYRANADHIKKVYILVRGKILVDTFMKQLVCNFSEKDEYINDNVLEGKNNSVRKSRLKREINKYYEIMTYTTFANRTINAERQSRSDEDLRREFSGCLFVIDEFHNLRVDTTEEEKEEEIRLQETELSLGKSDITTVAVSGASTNITTLSLSKPSTNNSAKSGEKGMKRRKVYDQINRVLKVVKRRKVIAMTATPMINSVDELRSPLNLLLPQNLQLPKSLDLRTASLQELEPYLRGRISFVRESKSEVNVIYETQDTGPSITIPLNALRDTESGETIEIYSQTRLWKVPMMASFIGPDDMLYTGQDTHYARVLGESQQFRLKERQASTGIFPDGSYDKKGHERYIMSRPVSVTQNPYQATPEYLTFLQHEPSRRGMSAVITNMIDIIETNPGNSFITTDFVAGASGVVNIGLYFEASGWQIFTGAETVFAASGDTEDNSFRTRYCGGKKSRRLRQLNFPRWRYDEANQRGYPAGTRDDGSYGGRTGPPRFAIISSYNSSYHEQILSIFNSPENMNGEIIRVLIVSQIGQEGINTANVINIFVPTPGWTASGTYQKIRRGIRATSHDGIIAVEKAKALAEGRDVNDVEVTVHIYLMAATRANPEEGIATAEIVYYNAEVKDIQIKRVERILKQVAIDCQLHKRRNMQPGDQPFSVDCDYMQSCIYECYPPMTGPIYLDTSSYDMLYADDVLAQIAEEVKLIFRKRTQLSFSLLYTLLDGYRHKLIDFALERMITDRETIIDRTGRRVYLEEEGDILYLTNSLVSSAPVSSSVPSSDYTLSFYEKTLQSTQQRRLAEVVSLLAIENQGPIIEALKTTPPTYLTINGTTEKNPQFIMLLDTLSVSNQIKLFEAATYKFYPYFTGDDFDTTIIAYFADNFFQQDEDMSELLSDASSSSLTPRASSSSNDSNDLLTDAYVHTLYDRTARGSSYAMTTQGTVRQIRIYKVYYERNADGTRGPLVEKEPWRDTNSYEYEIYKKMIINRIQREREQMEEIGNGVYGIFLRNDNKFRIVDNRVDRDSTGAICKDSKLHKLIEILWFIREPPANDFTTMFTREQLITELISMQPVLSRFNIYNQEDFPEERLRFYYNWLVQKNNVEQLCNILFNNMNRRGIISTR